DGDQPPSGRNGRAVAIGARPVRAAALDRAPGRARRVQGRALPGGIDSGGVATTNATSRPRWGHFRRGRDVGPTLRRDAYLRLIDDAAVSADRQGRRTAGGPRVERTSRPPSARTCDE